MTTFLCNLVNYKSNNVFVGDIDIGIKSGGSSWDGFTPMREWVLRNIKTGKIEDDVSSIKQYATRYMYTDFNAKYEYMVRKGCFKEYLPAIAIAAAPVIPAIGLSMIVRERSVLSTMAKVIVPSFRLSFKTSAISLAVLGFTVPICLSIAYATLPREKLSIYRLRTEARANMEDECEATDCLVIGQAKEIKGKDGEDLVTGSRLTKVVAKTGRKKRRPYAAKIAQVARAKVGYLKNTPENRLIYQRVLLEIMDKDCVRYVDRDMILPLAIGCCFVYTDESHEAAGLWGSEESLGVK